MDTIAQRREDKAEKSAARRRVALPQLRGVELVFPGSLFSSLTGNGPRRAPRLRDQDAPESDSSDSAALDD